MKKSYHHGDLKNVLVIDSVDHLREVGVENFSLRKVAVGSGVTPSAVYAHYKDKSALLNAVGKYAYEKFTESLEASLQGSDKNRVLEYAKAYANFALDHETLFSLIFSPYFKLTSHDDLLVLKDKLDNLHKNALLDIGMQADKIESLMVACRGRIHGIVNLIINNQLLSVDKSDRNAVLDLIAETATINLMH